MEKNAKQLVITDELLEQIHACQQEILDELVRLCEQLGLRYYLAYGTLLGAVRHHGPIPWDDDIDVMMPREDLEILKKYLLTRLEGEEYHIHCRDNDMCFSEYFIRLNKANTVCITEDSLRKGLRYQEVWLDIFPLDEAPDSRIWGTFLHVIRRLSFNKDNLSTEYLRVRAKVLHALLKPISREKLRQDVERCMRLWNGTGRTFYMSTAGPYPPARELMPRTWFEPAEEMEYRGKKYRVPKQWDKVLKGIYNDYMLLPPRKRGEHTTWWKSSYKWRHKPAKAYFRTAGTDPRLSARDIRRVRAAL